MLYLTLQKIRIQTYFYDMTNGFIRIASASPLHRVGDVEYNVEQMITMLRELDEKGTEIVVFPELSVTGYTCADLFHNSALLDAAAAGAERIRMAAEKLEHAAVIFGVPRRCGNGVRNSAMVCGRGIEPRYVDKTYLPNYNEFYEKRWFASAESESEPIDVRGVKVGIEICEDLWAPVPPSCRLAMKGAQIIFNLSASDDQIGKYAYLRQLISQQSARCIAVYCYASAGFGESTTDVVFLPKNIICENGRMLASNNPQDYMRGSYVIADVDIEAIERDRMHNTTFDDCARRNGIAYTAAYVPGSVDLAYSPEYREVSDHPFVPPTDELLSQRCAEILTIQECGLASRLSAIGNPKIVVGISGGLDSTLALIVAVSTMKRLGREASDIVAVTMPGFGTTDRTYENALTLMKRLGVTMREISIADAVNLHFKEIGHDADVHDVTYENSQARQRTLLLMDIANQVGGIVLGTGDLSELALGWATYNGDHMSMYGVNAGVPKTLVKYLVGHFAKDTADRQLGEALFDVIDTPISPELTPADEHGHIKQKTESFVGPYALNDFFLYYMLRYGFSPSKIFVLARNAFAGKYSPEEITKWLKVFFRRFFTQQFKRSCLPDGPKVGSVCLSPRGDWRMPSDASFALWMREVEAIEAYLAAEA